MAEPSLDADLSDPVTRHMRTDPARVRIERTVGEALAELRETPPPARIVYFYVVDADGRLCGVVPARALLLSPPETPVAEIMLKSVIAIPADATVLDACEFFVLHRFLAFPVVDSQRRLVGAIDVELYTDELLDLGEGSYDDLFQLVGVHLTQARQRGPIRAFRYRFPWLLCNIVGGILAALLSGVYRAELERLVTLALFIPVVLALAESVSIQSLSLALQALHGKPLAWSAVMRKLHGESLVGLLLGAAAGLVVGAAALAWLGQLELFVAVSGGIAAGVVFAAALGMFVPNLLHWLRLDPRVAAGPIVLATTDMMTLLCYFNLARWLLH